MNSSNPFYKEKLSPPRSYSESLRVEPNAKSFYVFAYHHMDVVKFESKQEFDVVTVSFLSHRVRITGTHLRTFAVKLQGQTIEAVRAVPERYSRGLDTEDCVIQSIDVEENSPRSN